MKYLPIAAKKMCEDKLFDAIANYRLLKDEIKKITSMDEERNNYMQKEKIIAELTLSANSDWSDEEERYNTISIINNNYKNNIEDYDKKLKPLYLMNDRLKTAFTVVNILNDLYAVGMINEQDLELLNLDINNHHFDSLISQLKNQPEFRTNWEFIQQLNEEKIEYLFNEMATKRILECQTKKELCRTITRIGLFPARNQKENFNPDILVQSVRKYIRDEEKTTGGITSLYGVSHTATAIKNKRTKEIQEVESLDSFKKGYRS